jgi:hypothetical protein
VFDFDKLDVSLVPEPSAVAIGAFAVTALVAALRRRG